VISIDFTAFLFLVSFIAFLFLLDLLFFKPVFKNIKTREEKSGGAREDINELQAKIAVRFKVLEEDKTISEAKIKANALILEARVKAGHAKEALIQNSAEDLSVKVEELLNAVEDDRLEIMNSSAEYIQQITAALSEKLNLVIKTRDSLAVSRNQDHSLV
jgi:F0F1-type ATP synthase membrane subunit b/b'